MKLFVSVYSLLILCLLSVPLIYAQNTTGSLAVPPNDNIPVDKLFSQLSRAPIDSQTNILLKISRYYWYSGSVQGLDSCRIYAIKSRYISSVRNNKEGQNEANFMFCKVLLREDRTPEAAGLLNLVYGEERIRLLMLLGEHFLFLTDLKKENTDKAFTYILRADNLCDSLHSKTWKYSCLLLLGKYYFAVDNQNAGKQSIMQIINDCARTKNIALEAHYWSELGKYTPSTDNTFLDQIHSHEMAAALFFQIGDKKDAAYSLRDVATLNVFHNKVYKAEQQMLQVISLLKATKSPLSFNTYNIMSIVYSHKGDYGKALHYLLLGSELLKPTQWHDKRVCYDDLALFYKQLNMPDKSIYYFNTALSIDLREVERSWSYHIMCDMIDEQVSIGQQRTALIWLNAFIKKYPPKSNSDQMFESTAYGELYNALKMYSQAEKYFLQMINYARKVEMEGTKKAQWGFQQSARVPYYNIGEFYVEREQYSKAKIYLLQALDFKNDNDPVINMNTEFQLYKINSVTKNYKSALHNFETYSKLNDSMSNVTKTRQLEELQIKYQTTQNEQSIKLLQDKSKYQQAELASSKFQKKTYIAGVSTALLLAGFACWGYQGKKRSNSKLKSKQIEINSQNGVLQKLLTDKDQLLGDKDSLITEKELLLREIHHRVKNNLQTTMSLLNMQSNYIDNEAALDAIRSSQHRMQAMSLIHQQLYQSDTVAYINMDIYMRELINYLKQSFNGAGNISFNLRVEELTLDAAEAVPLGLIVNEAVTNAIKYAFPDGRTGNVDVILKAMIDYTYILKVNDDGIGIPDSSEQKATGTLGMNLMKGLCEQLEGEFRIDKRNGTSLIFNFKVRRNIQ